MKRKTRGVAIRDERRQIGGVFLSPGWVENPALAQTWLRQIADMGYGSALILIRHMRRTVLDQAVHEGEFEFHVPFPNMMGSQILFEELCAVFQFRKGGYRLIPSARISTTAMHVGVPKPGVVLKGRISGRLSGSRVTNVKQPMVT
ncbi:MAG: hypothetical protein PHR35_12350 [Kiritimatiellae bacterium]|nr:hypothetical protein [Kiritimatiellia bacterium]